MERPPFNSTARLIGLNRKLEKTEEKEEKTTTRCEYASAASGAMRAEREQTTLS